MGGQPVLHGPQCYQAPYRRHHACKRLGQPRTSAEQAWTVPTFPPATCAPRTRTVSSLICLQESLRPGPGRTSGTFSFHGIVNLLSQHTITPQLGCHHASNKMLSQDAPYQRNARPHPAVTAPTDSYSTCSQRSQLVLPQQAVVSAGSASPTNKFRPVIKSPSHNVS
jgi:hypothetical protein